MSVVSFPPEYAWQSGELPVCTVSVPVAELSHQLGVPLASWEEAGLGKASGFVYKLASGEVLLLEEFAHAREHLGAAGPTVYTEVSTLVELGIERTVTTVLAGLGISPANLTWVQTEAGLRAAQQVVHQAKTHGQNGA